MNPRCQPPVRLFSILAGLFLLLVGFCPSVLNAQSSSDSAPGLELQISSVGVVYAGVPAVLRGRSYNVTGLADLTPAARGIEVRFEPLGQTATTLDAIPWHAFRSGDDGHFVTSLTPQQEGPGALKFRAAGEDVEATIAVPLAVAAPLQILLRTDRRFYERDEPVHAWGLVTDAHTGIPVPNREAHFTLADGDHRQSVTVRSNEAGVIYHRFEASPERGGNHGRLSAHFESATGISPAGELQVLFGDRTQEPLFVEVEMPEQPTIPGSMFEVSVRVVGAAGQILEGVHLEALVGGARSISTPSDAAYSPVLAQTDSEGRVTLRLLAPSLSRTFGTVVYLTATHSSYGTVAVERDLLVGRPERLLISAYAQNGMLMTGVRSRVWISALGVGGQIPPEGTRIRLQGPGLDTTASTDASGIAEFEVLASLDDTGPFRRCEGGLGLSASVFASDASNNIPTRQTGFCLGVVDQAWVRPVVAVRAKNPGSRIEVTIERAAPGRRGAVVVELSVGGRVIEALVTRESRVSFDVPAIYGVAHITTRFSSPMPDGHSRPTLSDAFMIVPERHHLSVASLAPNWSVPGDATVRVTTSDEGWFAVNVRDLAQHGGETPFEAGFWPRRFRRALEHPAGEVPARLLAVVLAPFARAPHSRNLRGATNGHIRHPFLRAREFRRTGAASLYRALEQRLASDASIGQGMGRQRRFRDDAIIDFEGFAGRPARPRDLERADASFSFTAAASRVGRSRLLKVLVALHRAERPDDSDRWLSALVRQQRLEPEDITDPWGGALGWRRRGTDVPRFFSERPSETLAFPGPDGRLGTADDIDHPFRRVIARGTPYAKAVGEDTLMERVAMLRVGLVALENMQQAMRQITQAMTDALAGDAVSASAIEADDGGGLGSFDGSGFGIGGTGTGTGGGGGYGRGARVPRIRSGQASVMAAPGSALLAAVRDEFPGTLFFEPAVRVRRDDGSPTSSIQTDISIPLAGATTTYLVEIVHWRADGWRQSTSTRFHTRLPLMISASLPEFANIGDELYIPARVESATEGRQTLNINLHEAERIVSGASLQIAGVGSAVQTRLRYTPDRVQEITLIASVQGAERQDAVSGSVQIRRPMLRRHHTTSVLARNHVRLRFRHPGRVRLHVDTQEFGFNYEEVFWGPWSERNSGRTPVDGFEIGRSMLSEQYLSTALGLALAWQDPVLGDDEIREVLEEHEEPTRPYNDALWLILIRPVMAELDRRPSLRRLLVQIAATRRARVMRAVMVESRNPTLFALAAAMLAQTGRANDRERAMQLLQRARRSRVQVGDATWVQYNPEGDPLTPGRGVDEAHDREASAALAYADVMLGAYDEALALLRTLARHHPSGSHPLPAMNLAFAAARVLGDHDLSSVIVQNGSHRQRVDIVGGQADLVIDYDPRHPLLVHGDGGLLRVQAALEYEQPWQAAARESVRNAPVQLRLEGPTAIQVLGRSNWSMRVHNHRAGVVSSLQVRVGLPAGASLDSESQTRLREEHGAGQSGGVLSLHIGPIFPGQSRLVAFSLRHTVSGQMTGLGVSATVEGREDRIAVLPPRTLTIRHNEPVVQGDNP